MVQKSYVDVYYKEDLERDNKTHSMDMLNWELETVFLIKLDVRKLLVVYDLLHTFGRKYTDFHPVFKGIDFLRVREGEGSPSLVKNSNLYLSTTLPLKRICGERFYLE